MISKDADIKCGWCSHVDKAENWNNNSKAACVSREMRRAYRDIYNEKVFDRHKKPAYYKCPKCSTWSKGSQLRIVNSDNPEHRRLGGEPVIKSVNRNKN